MSDFQQQARAAVAGIHGRGRRAILVGGSGLYVRAALDVLEFPGTDPDIRARLEQELAAAGPAPLRERLRDVDPVSAGRLGDARRIIRALEVFELTGRPFSSFMPNREYFQPTVQIGLEVDREAPAGRLAERVHRMVDRGLLAEVERLDAAGLRRGRTAPRALGYAQFLKVLDGECGRCAGRGGRRSWPPGSSPAASSPGSGPTPRITWLDWQDPALAAKAAALCR